MHALGVICVRPYAVIRYIDDETERIEAEAEPQELSTISYALAALGEKGATRRFKELEREGVVQRLVQEGYSQAISITTWAMADSGAEGVDTCKRD